MTLFKSYSAILHHKHFVITKIGAIVGGCEFPWGFAKSFRENFCERFVFSWNTFRKDDYTISQKLLKPIINSVSEPKLQWTKQFWRYRNELEFKYDMIWNCLLMYI
jgi:hypothetical protein